MLLPSSRLGSIFPSGELPRIFLAIHLFCQADWLKVHQPNETYSKRSDEDENIPPSPPTQQTNNGWLILFPPTMLNWLENIRSGNKTLWFKVNILPSDIENNCLSWIKVLRKGASFVMIQYSESLGLKMLIGRCWMEDALLLVGLFLKSALISCLFQRWILHLRNN